MANGRRPRTGQVQKVLISLYDILRFPSAPLPLEVWYYTFTHAYFPRWHNPYIFAEFGSQQFSIEFQDQHLFLDFDNLTRNFGE